jgi:hypothetical protein
MLGRHVYRVRPAAPGPARRGWQVLKEGEASVRGTHKSQQEAEAAAARLAEADQPSRLVIEDEAGGLVGERVFGKDDAAILDDDEASR